MPSSNTLLIKRNEVASLLSIEECISAVEQAFKLRALGKAMPPGILGVHASQGGFHIKAGILNLSKPYFASKTNANFPQNMKKNGLPTIQGIIVVSDAENGKLLALMDSMEVTIIRTGAATAVAAKYLSLPETETATICGCGNQGKISLRALMKVRQLKTVYAYDVDIAVANSFATALSKELKIDIHVASDLSKAVKQSQIVITCTTSKKYFLHQVDVVPGTFIAAVGSDSEDKQELEPSLLVSSKVVTDSTDQCAAIGELHHALEPGILKRENVYGELGEIIAGLKKGRTSEQEIIIFDSTGTALQDVAASAIVYEKAIQKGIGYAMDLGE